MPTLSKLSDECKKCPHVDDCNNKRMVACAMAVYKSTINNTAPMGISASQPMYKPEHSITINMGNYGFINTSHEEIAEKINKEIGKRLGCVFNK